MHEVRPVVLVREGNALLVIYSLDTYVNTLHTDLKSHEGSIEALNFLIIAS